ncbi:MAG: hypothetical protein ABJJ53_19385 [Sulfitobacter sp.]
MKTMLLAFVAIVVITIGANTILRAAGFTSQERGSSENVRVDS